MKELETIIEVIKIESRSLVGKLCKRVEVLEKEKSLNSKLYKSLVKELIYEHSRNLQKLIRLQVEIGKVEFIIKPKENN